MRPDEITSTTAEVFVEEVWQDDAYERLDTRMPRLFFNGDPRGSGSLTLEYVGRKVTVPVFDAMAVQSKREDRALVVESLVAAWKEAIGARP